MTASSKINISHWKRSHSEASYDDSSVGCDNPFLAVTILTFFPKLRQAPPSALQQKAKSVVQASARAGENGAGRPGRATDTTTNPNNSLIDGADKRLAQSTQQTCAHLDTHTKNTCLIPASAPSSCSLSVLTSSSSSSCFCSAWASRLSLKLGSQILWEKIEKGIWEMSEGDKRKGKRGSLCELWFICVVGSSEYAFRHFWSCSMAHSAFLYLDRPLPWYVPCVLMPWTPDLDHTSVWGQSKVCWH